MASVNLIGAAVEMNAENIQTDLEGFTVAGEAKGDWRVTVQRIGKFELNETKGNY